MLALLVAQNSAQFWWMGIHLSGLISHTPLSLYYPFIDGRNQEKPHTILTPNKKWELLVDKEDSWIRQSPKVSSYIQELPSIIEGIL